MLKFLGKMILNSNKKTDTILLKQVGSKKKAFSDETETPLNIQRFSGVRYFKGALCQKLTR